MHVILPAFLDTSQRPHVVTVSMYAVRACNGVVPIDEISRCSVGSIGVAVPMYCICIIK